MIRPARYVDFECFYGHGPQRRVKAWVVERDGDIVGMAGVEYYGTIPVIFSDIAESVRGERMFIARSGLEIMQRIRAMRIQALAQANESEANAPRFLRFLGFSPVGETIYVLGDE